MDTRKRKTPGKLRAVLAERVSSLMEIKYANAGDKHRALAKDAEITLSSVQRVLNETSGAGIETIESLARALDVEPYELLVLGDEIVTNATDGASFVRVKSLDGMRDNTGRTLGGTANVRRQIAPGHKASRSK